MESPPTQCEKAEGPKKEPVLPTTSIIREYRIVLPLSVDEYHIGQLYGVAEASKNETGGGEGIEVLDNRPISTNERFYKEGCKGQYTHKRFYLASKVPMLIRRLAPNNSLEIDEKAWNCYPYCRTEYSNRYMGDNFHIIIETRHKADRGDTKNIHGLTEPELKKRTIDLIDIANDPKDLGYDPADYKESEDPKTFRSEVTGRGPLYGNNWQSRQEPVMCCYKLYRVLFKWWMFQNKVEKTIMNSVRRLLFNFHRQVFCWIDKWYGMTIDDIRTLEDHTKAHLEELRKTGSVKGMVEKDAKE